MPSGTSHSHLLFPPSTLFVTLLAELEERVKAGGGEAVIAP
jgi:hypothetical protein